MAKIFENKKTDCVRTVSILGFPLYISENTADFRVQKFLGGIIYTKRDKSEIKETKIFKVFNIAISERIVENDIIRYYCANHLINEFRLVDFFYKKYLKKIKFSYDDVYVFNSNSGEIYLFLAYLAKAFLHKNQSKNPLFVTTKGYHTDMLKLYLPESKYIFIPKLKLKTKNINWECCGHRFYILFPGNYFQKIEQDIKEKQIGEVHYLESMLSVLKLSKNDFTPPETAIPAQIIDSLSKKINKLNLKLNNFIVLAPEALTCEEISKEFWQKLAKEISKHNIDVYLNITNKKNLIPECKNLDLNYGEIRYLAEKAKAIVSLRSGLSEFLLPTKVPNIVIYTKFRKRSSFAFSIDKEIEGFSMLKMPFVKEENIKELNYDKFTDEKELLNRVLDELEKFKVFNSEKEGQ